MCSLLKSKQCGLLDGIEIIRVLHTPGVASVLIQRAVTEMTNTAKSPVCRVEQSWPCT